MVGDQIIADRLRLFWLTAARFGIKQRATVLLKLMPQLLDDGSPGQHVEAILNLLVEARWISDLVIHHSTKRYTFQWTAQGKERAKWVNLIDDELRLGPEGFQALLVICRSHPPR